ncbi:MAG: hypothetical protein J6U14_02915 [Bacteroidaceae bacterium]|nr:hypothetical protein [Bacteroidaceae bacterium]
MGFSFFMTKNKKVVQIEIDDNVKKLTIEGMDKDAQVIMREELTDDELDNVASLKNVPLFFVINQ